MKIKQTTKFTTDSNNELPFLKTLHTSENPNIELIPLNASARPDGTVDYTYYEIDKNVDSN
jgi:hypothetical protein